MKHWFCLLATLPIPFLISCGSDKESAASFDRELARSLLSQVSLPDVVQVTNPDALCLEQNGMLLRWRIVGKATSAIRQYNYVNGLHNPDSITFVSPLQIEVTEITGIRDANQGAPDNTPAKRIEFSGAIKLAGGESRELYEAVSPCLSGILQINSGVAVAEMYDDGWRIRIESGLADRPRFK